MPWHGKACHGMPRLPTAQAPRAAGRSEGPFGEQSAAATPARQPPQWLMGRAAIAWPWPAGTSALNAPRCRDLGHP
jgi:hypothetical protein